MTNSKKQCSACKGWFERTSENFYRDANTPDGYKARCKACVKIAVAKRARLAREANAKTKRRTVCSKCGAEINSTGGYCRECYNEYQRQRREERRKQLEMPDWMDEPKIGPNANACQPMGYAITPVPGMWGWNSDRMGEERSHD
jgi:hypothetical protein